MTPSLALPGSLAPPAGGAPEGRSGLRLLRSAGVRFAVVYALLLALSAAALALFLWWATAGLLDRQTEAAIQADAQSLSERFVAGSLPGLVLTIEDRLTQDVEDDFGLPSGRSGGSSNCRQPDALATGGHPKYLPGTSFRSSGPACARWRWCKNMNCRAAFVC